MKLKSGDIGKIMFVITLLNLVGICLTCDMLARVQDGEREVQVLKTATLNSDELNHNEESIEESCSYQIEERHQNDYYIGNERTMEEIFYEMIVGNYKVNQKMQFNFGLNGLYSGFFDDVNDDVSGYSYEIVAENENAFLHIYNKDRSAVMSYEISLSGRNMVLYYPELELSIILEK